MGGQLARTRVFAAIPEGRALILSPGYHGTLASWSIVHCAKGFFIHLVHAQVSPDGHS